MLHPFADEGRSIRLVLLQVIDHPQAESARFASRYSLGQLEGQGLATDNVAIPLGQEMNHQTLSHLVLKDFIGDLKGYCSKPTKDPEFENQEGCRRIDASQLRRNGS